MEATKLAGYTRISPLPHLHLGKATNNILSTRVAVRDNIPERRDDRYSNMVEAAPMSMASLGTYRSVSSLITCV